jgi:hypothetical protein
MLNFEQFFLLNDAISIQNAKDMQLNRKSGGAYNVRVYKNDPETAFKNLGLEKLNWEATMNKMQEVLKTYTEKYKRKK